MPSADKACVIYVRSEREAVEKFDKVYPSMRSRFLTGCLRYAVNNKDFVMQILFGELGK